MKTKLSNTVRKLEDSSWLAQIIKDKMEVESEAMGLYPSTYWKCLHTLYIIVKEADDKENEEIYYNNGGITICNIPSLMEYGFDYDTEGMQNQLRGLQNRYTDDDGNYIVSVLTTNDLNSATIKSISELLYVMQGVR
jgi:hypothetical protein